MLHSVISCSKVIQEARRVVKLYSCEFDGVQTGREWYSIILEHPDTFEKLAMDPELRRRFIDDLDRLLKERSGIRKLAKHGYLIHGPPGTGKSALIAAMANHLEFDIFLKIKHFI